MRNVQPLSKKDAKKIGGYTLIGRLGSGGMGVVYLASKGSESVALKVVRDSLIEDDAQLSRFKREIETLESINHPNVARILDSGVDGEQAWFAAEFANGPDLSARVKDKGPLDEDEWWTLAEGLMSALAAVHAAGVIHRDVKPSNVILTEAGPKLIDFGIAHVSDATSVTSTGMVAGSPAWFSPEQIEGFDLTPATDVFSAGSVLTLAATGSSPWGDETTMTKASVFKILTNEPNIEGLVGLRGDFVERLLEKEPGDRPSAQASADAAAARDVSRLASGSSVSGGTTRVAPRPAVDKVGPSFTRSPTQTPHSSVTKTSEDTNSSKNRRFGLKAIAAVLIPVVAALFFIVARQSEGRGDTRVVVRVADANPIVGSGLLTLSSESQNPQTLSVSEREMLKEVIRWSSWEDLRVTYDPPFSQSEGLEVTLSPSDLGLSGFNHGQELKLLVSLKDDMTLIELLNNSTDATLKTWRLTRENEQDALNRCATATDTELRVELKPLRNLNNAYLASRERAGLGEIGDGTLNLRYTTWSARARNLADYMDQDLASARAAAPSDALTADYRQVLTERHERLRNAWLGLALSAERNGSGWSDAWDEIYAAQRANSTAPRSLISIAREKCTGEIQ